jgi:hypothetical protein
VIPNGLPASRGVRCTDAKPWFVERFGPFVGEPQAPPSFVEREEGFVD